MATVIDKRYLQAHVDHEILHKKAYEFLLERIEHYMTEFHPKHNAVIVMDDTSKELNRAVAMKHALFQRRGNQNVHFRHIVEYPFFTRSELSVGSQKDRTPVSQNLSPSSSLLPDRASACLKRCPSV